MNEQSQPLQVDLPGVQNMRTHALMAERAKKEMEAALKIQAAYRGYNVRKSLKWGQPPPKSPEEFQPPKPPSSEVFTFTTTTSSLTTTIPSASHVPIVMQPRSVPEDTLMPWKQTGGDNYSVINVFTRQHQQLRDTLSQLSDRRRDEIRNLSSQPSPAITSQPSPAITSQHSTGKEQFSNNTEQVTPPKQSPPSYTPKSNSHTYDVVSMHSGSTMSFSEDSLCSNSPPPSRTQSQNSNPQSSTSQRGTPQNLSTHSQDTQQASPSKQESSNSSNKSVSSATISAITPPGSLSFVDSFSSPPHVHVPLATSYMERTDGRISPRSLELQHQAQLNHYEMTEQNLHHLNLVERTRDLSTAQQETVTLAQQLKAQEQAHKNELSELANKAKLEIEAIKKRVETDSMYSTERLRQLQEKADLQAKEHTKRLAVLQQDSERAAQEATLRLNEARSAATDAVIESAQQQIQTAHTIAISAATAATKEAVKEVLKHKESITSPPKSNDYESDFDPSTTQPETDANTSGSSKDTTLTPAQEEEGEDSDDGQQSSTHEVTEEINEVSPFFVLNLVTMCVHYILCIHYTMCTL